MPYVRPLEQDGAVSVWLVDGAYVRKNLDGEFSNCGHHYSCSVIPDNMRLKAGDVCKLNQGKKTPRAKLVHARLWKALGNGVHVWFVKGRLVRSMYDVEFTEGGHDYVYEFVPPNEVWIDDDVH
jgi:hypothetical protein